MHFRIILLMMFASLSAVGQHEHYIYIQSDNAQNFYIRKGTDIISSSASGYVILPRIPPGQQNISIGFPKNEFPEYQFTFDIKGKDRGFALKNFEDKGWGLFDLQSLEVIMGKRQESKKEEKKNDGGTLTNDPFSVILASAVGDPRIRQTSLVYREEMTAQSNPPPKTDAANKTTSPPKTEVSVTAASVVAKDPSANTTTTRTATKDPDPPSTVKTTSKDPAVKEETATNTVLVKEEVKTPPENISTDSSTIKATTSTQTTVAKSEPEAKKGIFKNPFAKKKTEPVSPAPGVVVAADESKKEPVSQVTVDAVAEKPTAEPVTAAKRAYVMKFSEYKNGDEKWLVYIDHQQDRDDTIRLSITEDAKPPAPLPAITSTDTLSTVTVTTPKKEPVKPDTVAEKKFETVAVKNESNRTDCKKMATEKDMVGMRKKMVMMADEDEMIALALKDFKQRCYSTERLQNLSYVFTTDKGRYKLFDAAFPYIYDPSNYIQLERLLNEDYYIKRFRTLVNKN